ncbi:hypothetical protein [uncultured Flavobacterium sp.]|uniref:hypothetical protein n=1 Tax=uncultured Flavobacterium sp. TaxID=165435 RepID=UPI0025CC70E8|nr:hypothetical protein [uncultured Flavobacterium sp.]
MKCLFIVLFAFIVLSCKKEGSSQATVGSIYPEEAVATTKNGVLTLLNEAVLSDSWEKRMDGVDLVGFEVVKGRTEGDAAEDFYMVVARTEEGVMVASLLEMRDNQFYFDTAGHEKAESYLLVVCKGACAEGCLPVVRITNGIKRIICSSCVDCAKNEVEVY